MKSKVPPNVFPPLQLSAKEQQAIVDYSDELVAETLQASEDFLTHHRRFNPERWKYMKTENHLHVYRSRRRKGATVELPHLLSLSDMSGDTSTEGPHSTSLSSADSRQDSDYLTDDSLLERARPREVPLLVVTGKMDGTVEDAAYGALADNEARWRLRDAYIGDQYDDQKILATIHSPSKDDPFRFLGVKWATRTFGAFIAQRDVVYVESTGLALSPNGERVCYILMHSYGLDRVPELSELGVIRARLSMCSILRPHSKNRVEVFCRAFNNMGGELLEGMTVNIFTDTLLAVGGLVECAYVKKLKWQMNAREPEAREHATSVASQAHAPTHCATCHHSLTKFGHLIHSGAACQVCHRVICNKCSTTKRVGVDFVDGAIMQKPMEFCPECITLAKKLPAWNIALDTLPRGGSRATSSRTTRSR
ncbi:hypothetical protein BBJ28_00006567 [Nothophytophthora sp. Chile5]|nr:hypothetical protein BBJ28_00006567 [Nothophytophthora sp. Chile5]